jgi:hypothetical protein
MITGNMAHRFTSPGAEHLAGSDATDDSMSNRDDSENEDDISAADLRLVDQLIADDQRRAPPVGKYESIDDLNGPLVQALGEYNLLLHLFPDSASTLEGSLICRIVCLLSRHLIRVQSLLVGRLHPFLVRLYHMEIYRKTIL